MAKLPYEEWRDELEGKKPPISWLFWGIVGLLAAILLGFMSFNVAKAETLTCRSPTVIDGDTIKCNGERVRLKAMDAPECHRYPCNDAASRWLRTKTRYGVTCDLDRARDRYGRRLGTCRTASSSNLSHDSISRGYSRAYTRPRYNRHD